MTRKLLLVLALVGMMFAGTAHAGRFSNFSFGYSDFGHHGGYNISVGGFGGRHWGGFGSSAPAYGFGYGHRDHWRERWNLSSYRRGYDDCYYGCRSSYRNDYPSRRDYSSYYDPRRHRGYDRHYRHDRHDRYDRHNRYDRHDYDRSGRDYSRNDYGRSERRSERAYDRAREDSRGLNNGRSRSEY